MVFESLPGVILDQILFELPVWDLLKLRKVCKHLRSSVDASAYWKEKMLDAFPDSGQFLEIEEDKLILLKILSLHLIGFSGCYMSLDGTKSLCIAQDPNNLTKGFFFGEFSDIDYYGENNKSFKFGGDFIADPNGSPILNRTKNIPSNQFILNIRYKTYLYIARRFPKGTGKIWSHTQEWSRKVAEQSILNICIDENCLGDRISSTISHINSGHDSEEGIPVFSSFGPAELKNRDKIKFVPKDSQETTEGENGMLAHQRNAQVLKSIWENESINLQTNYDQVF
jgi:hypothetical protein